MRHGHAVEVTLTAPAMDTHVEALHSGPLGLLGWSSDRRRAVVVVGAKTPKQAVDRVWEQTADGGRLPVDTVCSLYPDTDGFVQLAVALEESATTALQERARHVGQSLDEFLAALLAESLRQDAVRRQAALRIPVGELLHRYSPEEVLRALVNAADPWGP